MVRVTFNLRGNRSTCLVLTKTRLNLYTVFGMSLDSRSEKKIFFDDLTGNIEINLTEPFKEWYSVTKVTEYLHK